MKLELSALCKSFGSHRAVDTISLTLNPIGCLVLIGGSGSGKSTLLRMIAGLETPTSGTIHLDDSQVVFEEQALLTHRRSIGTVFQAFNLFAHLTAMENITLPLEKVQGWSKPDARQRALDVLARFRLASHAEKMPASLSGGERQRVAIARAVAIRPRILLFDEPTSALDPEMTAEVLDLIGELRNEGRKIILVTHEMGFARQAADQIAFLKDGRLVESGPAAQLFSHRATNSTQAFISKVLKY